MFFFSRFYVIIHGECPTTAHLPIGMYKGLVEAYVEVTQNTTSSEID